MSLQIAYLATGEASDRDDHRNSADGLLAAAGLSACLLGLSTRCFGKQLTARCIREETLPLLSS